MSDELDAAQGKLEYGPRDPKPRKLPHLTQDDLVCVLDEDGRKHYWTKEGRPVCGRHKKQKNRVIPDEACLGIPMANGACNVHGGKAGRPITHGRYSRVLKKWKKDYARAQADKDLLDAKKDLAMLDVAIEKLVGRAEDGDCPTWRKEVGETFIALQGAIRGKRQSQVSAHLKRLGELIESGAAEDQVANDLVVNVERRANRATRINEYEFKKEEKIPPSELAAVFRSWLAILEKRLEPKTYHALLPELRLATHADAQ